MPVPARVAPSTPTSGCPIAGGFGGIGNPSDGGIAGGFLGVFYTFLQFAGFTLGKAGSAVRRPLVQLSRRTTSTAWLVAAVRYTGVNQLTYTGRARQRRVGRPGGTGPGRIHAGRPAEPDGRHGGRHAGRRPTASTTSPAHALPDLIAAIKIEQAWGLLKASFAAHNNTRVTMAPRNRLAIPTATGALPFRVRCRSGTFRPAWVM